MKHPFDTAQISALFEAAAFDPATFPDVCEKTSAALGANAFYLLSLDAAKPIVIGGESVNDFIRYYYEDGWWQVDVLTQAAQAKSVRGFQLEQEIVPDDVRKQSEIVHEFRRRRRLDWCAGWGFEFEGQHWGFAALRGEPFDRSDAPAFAGMAPSITRAAMFASRLNMAQAKGMAEGLEAAQYAAIVLDHRGVCTLATPSAEALFSAEFGPRAGMLWSRDREAHAGLAALAACARLQSSPTPPAVVVPRGDGRRPILVTPLRVRGVGLDGLPGARLILSLIDLEARRRPHADLLCDLYRPTPMETQIAVKMAQGMAPAAIAAALRLRLSTLRQYVKTILAKTNTHRQAELVAVLARLPSHEQHNAGDPIPK